MERPRVAIQNSIRVRMTLAAFLVFTITFFCYRSALYNGFVWDDFPYIVKNIYITELNWENIKWMLTGFHVSNWHPLTWLSLAIDYMLFGRDAWGYHLTNIILHSLNAVLVLILTIILLRLRENHRVGMLSFTTNLDERIFFAGLIAAILFGVHPQHVESVAWVTERKDVLSLFFTLLSLLTYVFYTTVLQYLRCYYFLSLLFFILALMAKPIAVTIPVILLLLDIYPLRRTQFIISETADNLSVPWQRILLEKVPFFLLALASITLTLLAQNEAMVHLDQRGLFIRLLNAFNSIILYIVKFLFPVNLQPFYINTPDPAKVGDYIPMLACILITLICFHFWRKKHYDLMVIWLFYLATLSPVVGIIQVGLQSSADRYAYLPTLPFYIVLGAIAGQLFDTGFGILNWISRISIIILAFVICIVLHEKTQQQITVWKSEWVLWNYIAHFNPDNGRVQANIGRMEYSYGHYSAAIERFQKASTLHMLLPYDLYLWAQALLKIGRLDEALEIYLFMMNEKVEIGAKGCSYYNLACILFRRGNTQEAQQVLGLITSDMPEYQQARDLATRITDSELDHDGARILPSCQFCEHD